MNVIRADILHIEKVASLFDAYRQFYKQKSDPAGCRAFIRERMIKGESIIYLAMENGRVVGFCQMYPSFSSVSMKPIWILYDLFIVPDSRRRGAGEALLRRAQAHAAETGAEGLILETAVDNRPGQRLYEKLGWKRDTLFHRYAFTVE